MGYDQVFNALQTGVVDGAENNPPSFVFDNHYQVAKFYTLDRAPDRPEMVVFSRRQLGLAVEGRPGARSTKFGREAQLGGARAVDRSTRRMRWTRPRQPASTIIEIADKTAFQDAVKPVWDKYGAQIRRY